MSTEKKNEKWKTFPWEKNESSVQSFAHPKWSLQTLAALHKQNGKLFNTEDTEKTRKRKT
jgi:hypothetical protein